MVEFNVGPEGRDIEGCLVVLEAHVDKEGELEIEELEQIDEQMTSVGTQRTGQRVEVMTMPDKVNAKVAYAYQESLMAASVASAEERLQAFTPFDNGRIFIRTGVFNLQESQ